MVSLGFVLCGVLSSTSRSYGWGVLRCLFRMDLLISVTAELTLESCFSAGLFKSFSPPLGQLLFTDLLGHSSL